VSVSMLTGAGTQTPSPTFLGVRAFGTQLLCEQVVGRGLRRVSYVARPERHFAPEYAEVYGVPVQLPCDQRPAGPDRPEGDPPGPGAPRAERARGHVSRGCWATGTTLPTARLIRRVHPRLDQGARDRRGVRSSRCSTRSSASRSDEPRRPQASAPAGGLVPDRQARPRHYFRARGRRRCSRGSTRSCSRSPSAGSRVRRPEGHAFPADAADHRVGARRRRPDPPGDRARHVRASSDHADPAALRPVRLDPLRRLHDDQKVYETERSHLNLPGDGLGLGGEVGQVLETEWTRSSPYAKNLGL